MSTLFSPEFISMIVGIAVSLIIAAVPQFESVRTELVAVVTVLVGLVIAGLGLERTAAARATGQTLAERQAVGAYKVVPPPQVKQP